MKSPHRIYSALAATSFFILAACQGGADNGRVPAFSGIGPEEIIHFTGTEPFWGGQTAGSELIYKTPDNIDGQVIAIERFAGNHGLGLSGTLDGAAFDMTVTPAACSDGMSDRTYPLTVTLSIGNEVREGCGWTDRKPYTEMENP